MRLTITTPDGEPVDLVGSPFHISTLDDRGESEPAVTPTLPPSLGQHTEEVLTELLGKSPSEVERLAEEGVI